MLAVLLAGAIAVGLSGCVPYWSRTDEDAAAVANWVREQDHVTEATSSTMSSPPYNSWLLVDVAVDPGISDKDLTELVRAVDEHCRGLGWPQVTTTYSLGGRYTLGGSQAASLPIFLRLRAEGRYDTINTAGTIAVTVPNQEVDALLTAVEHIQGVARDSGGVQSNLEVSASAGALSVRATADILPVEGAALLDALVTAGVPWIDAEVFTTEFGDQSIWITLETEEQRGAILALASAAVVPGTPQDDALPGGVNVSDVVNVQTFLLAEVQKYR